MNSPISLSGYNLPDVIRNVETLSQGQAPDTMAKSIEDEDLALLVHLGRYFEGKITKALRHEMRQRKRVYDNEGESYKTPFGLREITDPTERAFIFANMHAFASTHGCSGGCEWCCYDALITKDREVVPLEQKKHFFDEQVSHLENVDSKPQFIKKIILGMAFYMDTDPFDDPEIVDLMTYIYEKWQAVPTLSTVVPKQGEDSFKELTGLAMEHENLKKSIRLLHNLQKIKKVMEKQKIKNFEELNQLIQRRKQLRELKDFLRLWESVWAFISLNDPGILKKQFEKYAEMLRFYDLEKIETYKADQKSILYAEVAAKIKEEESILPKEEVAETLLTRLLEGYETHLRRYSNLTIQECIDGETGEEEIQEMIRKQQENLKGKPDIGNIRVSLVQHREKEVKKLLQSGNHRFYVQERDVVQGGVNLAGIIFFNAPVSQTEEKKYGISCENGMLLTPFALLNSVAGYITKKFPQGRVIVPYKGLKKETSLARKGEQIENILSHLIVINNTHFKGESPNKIFVYDGEKRVREIYFDRATYEVISDKIIKENIEELKDIQDLKELWN